VVGLNEPLKWRIRPQNQMKVSDAYNNWSSSYDSDRNLTRDLDASITRNTFGHVKLGAILEVGCGTGKNTDLLSQVGDRLVALDLSAGMINLARAKVQSSRVQFVMADVSQPWPCVAETFDLVVCNLILEHIEDLNPVFAEAQRMLRSGGRLFLSELHPFRQYQGTVANFQRGESRIEIPAFVHHLSEFIQTAKVNDLSLLELREWWHEEDQNKPPRLVSFMFAKPAN
jgi:ubiquinone/menaquinone biosynthesis C-methylase UbiE